MKLSNFEMLGGVLDGAGTIRDREIVLLNMSDSVFEECFMVALRARTLFNDNSDVYETI